MIWYYPVSFCIGVQRFVSFQESTCFEKISRAALIIPQNDNNIGAWRHEMKTDGCGIWGSS